MNKYIKIVSLLVITFLLSSCAQADSVDQVNVTTPDIFEEQSEYYWTYTSYGDELFYYEDILKFSNDSLSFEVFLTIRDTSDYYYFDESDVYYDYSYTFMINVTKQTTLTFECDEEIFDVEFNPSQSYTYTRSIPLNAFMDSCGSSGDVLVTIKEDGNTVFEESFLYTNQEEFDLTTLQELNVSGYDYTNFLYIFLVGIVVLFLLVMGYRLYYNYRINKNFLNSNKKTFYLADIWVVFVLSSVVVVILVFTTIFISREKYNDSHYEQIYSTLIDYTFLDIDSSEFRVIDANVAINSNNQLSYDKDTNEPIEVENFIITDDSFIDDLAIIIDELNTYQSCNVDFYYDCFPEIINPSYSFTVQDGNDFYRIQFLLDEDLDVKSISVTNMEGYTYLIIDGYGLEEQLNSIRLEIEDLITD